MWFTCMIFWDFNLHHNPPPPPKSGVYAPLFWIFNTSMQRLPQRSAAETSGVVSAALHCGRRYMLVLNIQNGGAWTPDLGGGGLWWRLRSQRSYKWITFRNGVRGLNTVGIKNLTHQAGCMVDDKQFDREAFVFRLLCPVLTSVVLQE